QKALELTNENNLEKQSDTQERIGLLAVSVADHMEAVRWLESAEATYRRQLDTSFPEVQTRLQALQALIEDSRARIPESE
ncbi:MAG: hypothetical protein AAFU53_09830, partial [Cyanobacteria bacterium J06632_3]